MWYTNYQSNFYTALFKFLDNFETLAKSQMPATGRRQKYTSAVWFLAFGF
jgi:hypothetical protein